MNSGLRRLLVAAPVYNWMQDFIGAKAVRRKIAEEHIRAMAGDRVLDIGCGTAEILGYLPEVEYYGFDRSERYIEAARKRFGHRGSFWQEHVSKATLEKVPSCDIALAIGVLHHLEDDEALRLFETAHAALDEGGRLITYDPCLIPTQTRLARMFVKMDRGRNVRWADAYRELALRVFGRVHLTIHEKHIRMPWTSLLMECEK